MAKDLLHRAHVVTEAALAGFHAVLDQLAVAEKHLHDVRQDAREVIDHHQDRIQQAEDQLGRVTNLRSRIEGLIK